jgi:hypothetical protein
MFRALGLTGDQLEPCVRAGVLDDLRSRGDVARDEPEQPAVVRTEQVRLVAAEDGPANGRGRRAHAGLLCWLR